MSKRDAAIRSARRARAEELRRAAKAEAARLQEEADEKLAPAVQRNAVMASAIDSETGQRISVVLRAARVQRDGVTFSRADPLKHIDVIAEKGGMFTKQHVHAAKRLVTSWDEVGDGIGLGASDWGSLSGSRGTVPTIPTGYSSLMAQVAQRMEIDAARTWLGALWPCVEDVALRGMSLSAWGTKAGIGRNAAPGYLLAALDRLVEFYKAREAEPARRPKVRSVAIGSRKGVDDPASTGVCALPS